MVHGRAAGWRFAGSVVVIPFPSADPMTLYPDFRVSEREHIPFVNTFGGTKFWLRSLVY